MLELDQLKDLVLRGGFDSDSIADVLQLEQKLKEAIAAQKLKQHPAIQAYLEYLHQEIDRCNVVMSESEDLPDRERIKLYERKQACRRFLEIFGENRADIDQSIKDMLNVAIQHQE